MRAVAAEIRHLDIVQQQLQAGGRRKADTYAEDEFDRLLVRSMQMAVLSYLVTSLIAWCKACR